MDGSNQVASLLGPLCALGSSVTWAIAASVYTDIAKKRSALFANLYRASIAMPLFILSGLIFCGPAAFFAISGGQIGWLAVSMICSYALGDLIFYVSAIELGTSPALAIASIYPLWAALFGMLLLGEKVSPARAAGTVLCIAGVIWLVLQQRQDMTEARASEKKAARRLFLGVGLALLASFFWAGNAYSIRRGAAGEPFLVVNAFRYSMAVLVLATAHFFTRRRRAEKAKTAAPKIPARFVFIVVLEAFFGSSIFVYGLSHSDLSVAAPLSSLAPLFSLPIGLYLGREKLSAQRLLAIVLTVAGVVLLVR